LVQRFFTTRFALYMGDISFSVYVTHWMVGMIVSNFTFKQSAYLFGAGTRDASHIGKFVCILYELLVVFFFSLWTADLFWQYVEQRTAAWSKWVENVLTAEY